MPVASSTVISKVLVAFPSSARELGLAVKKLVVPAAGPVENVTFAVLLKPAKAAVTMTVCATVLFNVTVHRPDAAVVHVVELKL